MKKEQKKNELIVTLSDKSIQDLADCICDNMEILLKPIYEEIVKIKRVVESIESNTDLLSSGKSGRKIKKNYSGLH